MRARKWKMAKGPLGWALAYPSGRLLIHANGWPFVVDTKRVATRGIKFGAPSARAARVRLVEVRELPRRRKGNGKAT